MTSLTIVYSSVFFQAEIKENIKAPRYWTLWGESTGDRWILRTKAQWREKMFPFDNVFMIAGTGVNSLNMEGTMKQAVIA